MAMIEVKCPMCRQTDVVKHGVDAKGKQRFVCREVFQFCGCDFSRSQQHLIVNGISQNS
jgi:transposase-like protein